MGDTDFGGLIGTAIGATMVLAITRPLIEEMNPKKMYPKKKIKKHKRN